MTIPVGSRVVLTRDYMDADPGLVGTVIVGLSNEFNGDTSAFGFLGIDFAESMSDFYEGLFHTLNGRLARNTGYWIPADRVRLLQINDGVENWV